MINQLSELLQIVVVDQQVVSALDMFYDVFMIDMIWVSPFVTPSLIHIVLPVVLEQVVMSDVCVLNINTMNDLDIVYGKNSSL